MDGIVDTLRGRHILLTGTTGFLGKVLLIQILQRVPGIGRITLLVRGRGKESALARFERIADTSPAFRPLRQVHGAELGAFLGQRISVVDGDVTRPLCGLDDAAVVSLGRVDAVVHCAGLTDFQPDPKKALAANTVGAARVADLSARLGARLLHVSTAYVAGVLKDGEGEVPETLNVGVSPNGTRFDPVEEVELALKAVHKPRRLDRVDLGTARAESFGWPNIYTWTKGLAEHLLAARTDVAVAIARPSVVECAVQTPFPGWNEGLNTAGPLAWLISTAFRRLPAGRKNNFDVVPVDVVGHGLLVLLAAHLQGLAPMVSHLASSDHNPMTFDRCIELTGLGMRRWVRQGHGTAMDRALFQHLDPVQGDGGWLLPFKLRDALPAMKTFLEDTREAQAPEWVQELAGRWVDRLSRMQSDGDQVEQMLELYRPFIRDNNYTFRTDHVRRLSAALPAEEDDLRFDMGRLCWREYWVDVEYPGLMTWSIPLIRGETIPDDLASSPPLQLTRPLERRAASK